MQTPPADPGLIAELGWIDLTALAILLVFFVLGLFRGFVWQLSRIVTLVVAYGAAGMYGGAIAEHMGGWFSEGTDPRLPLYIAYFCVFVAVLVVASLLALLLERLVRASGLSFYNRLGGGLLGVGTGGCVVLAMLAAIVFFFGTNSSIAEAARSSRSMQVGRRTLELLGDAVPEPVRESFGIETQGEPDPAGSPTEQR